MSHIPVTIITPCYNENITVIRFLEALENVLIKLNRPFYVIVVNDCSTDNTLSLLEGFHFHNEKISLKIINLNVNAGHQAAIYRGLCYARDLGCYHFIIMDADGEDSPSVIPQLLDHADTDIVHVVRSSRQESILFRCFYRAYKILFRLITGKQMNYGNFCLISRPVLEKAVLSTFAHFAAFLSRQQFSTKYICAGKEKRLGGQSKMSFKKHLSHALKSFVEYRTENSLLKQVRHQNSELKHPAYEINSTGNPGKSI